MKMKSNWNVFISKVGMLSLIRQKEVGDEASENFSKNYSKGFLFNYHKNIINAKLSQKVGEFRWGQLFRLPQW